ncbi:MAG: glycoside hydrolase family 97 catalytic domain-containing protein [Planctomycetota bacterium]
MLCRPLLTPLLLVALAPTCMAAGFTRVADCVAPSGRLRAEVGTDATGHLAWRLAIAGRSIIDVSRAGVIVAGVDSGAAATVGKPVLRTIDQAFPWRGPETQRREQCQVAEYPVQSGGQAWTFEVRVFDDGAAYRCRIPGTGKRHITGESATFVLPEGEPCYVNPNTATYEGIHIRTAVQAIKARDGIGMPMTFQLSAGGYAAITEAQSMGWSGMTLEATGTSMLRCSFRDDPKGWDIDGDIVTPWRVVMETEDLNGLVHVPIVDALCPPPDPTLFPQGIHTPWLKPGRCLWQWWAFDDPGTHWSKQKAFVDKAAALACEYYLVDEGWEHTRQEWFKPGEPDRAWPRMKELCSYAKTKGVGIWVWRGWTLDKGRQWPGLETHAKRVDFFRRCREAGVAGAKIDFMDSESHNRLEFYQDCLKVAAENQIMLNFHGANKPTGEARTWPNEMTREGIRGLEYNKWDTSPPSHYATLPFTRLLAGHADFTPTTFNPKFLKGTTVAQQLACAVVLSTPMLCWAENPDLYLASPALDAIRAMPVVWDETRVLPQSRIGELAVFARRSGDEWWVGVINGGGSRTVELPMDFLGAGDWTADRYADGAKPTDFAVTRAVVLSAADKHKVDLAAGGGLTLRIRKK